LGGGCLVLPGFATEDDTAMMAWSAERLPERWRETAIAGVALNGLREPAPLILGFDRLDLQGLNHSVADLLGVRYAVVSPQTGEPPPGWKRVKRGRLAAEWTLRGRAAAELPYEIYENPTALPRCFAVGGVRVLGPTDLASQVLATIDPRREVLLGQDVLGDVPRTEFRPARLVRFTPGEVVVEVTRLPGPERHVVPRLDRHRQRPAGGGLTGERRRAGRSARPRPASRRIPLRVAAVLRRNRHFRAGVGRRRAANPTANAVRSGGGSQP